MPDKKQLLDELNYLTDAVSSRFRAISTGVVAVCWAFIVTDKPDLRMLTPQQMIVPLTLSLLSLLFDSSQYLFGYFNNRLMLRTMEKTRADSMAYSTRSWSYKGRVVMFWLKIITSATSMLLLIALLGRKIFGG